MKSRNFLPSTHSVGTHSPTLLVPSPTPEVHSVEDVLVRLLDPPQHRHVRMTLPTAVSSHDAEAHDYQVRLLSEGGVTGHAYSFLYELVYFALVVCHVIEVTESYRVD